MTVARAAAADSVLPAAESLLASWTLGTRSAADDDASPVPVLRVGRSEELREEPTRRATRLRQLVAALQRATEDAKRRRRSTGSISSENE